MRALISRLFQRDGYSASLVRFPGAYAIAELTTPLGRIELHMVAANATNIDLSGFSGLDGAHERELSDLERAFCEEPDDAVLAHVRRRGVPLQ